jgi:hypothetical protein
VPTEFTHTADVEEAPRDRRLARLFPIIRPCHSWFGSQFVAVGDDGICLTRARRARLTEEVARGQAPLPGPKRQYAFGDGGPGERIERVRMQTGGRISMSRHWLRFAIITGRGADRFWLLREDTPHVTLALRTLLGARFEKSERVCFSPAEKALGLLGLCGGLLFLLGLSWFVRAGDGSLLGAGLLLVPAGLALLASLCGLGIRMFFEVPSPHPSAGRTDAMIGARSRTPGRPPFRSRLLGWLVKVAALGYFAFLFFFPVPRVLGAALSSRAGMRPNPVLLLMGVTLLTLPGWLCLHAGYRLGRRTFRPGSHPDRRPPVVYLRSFADDGRTTLQPDTYLASCHGLRPEPGSSYARKMLDLFITYLHPVRMLRLFFDIGADTSEEVLASGFRGLGPFVAIGRPAERLATPGADRMYVGDDEWRGVVVDHLDRCAAVVVQPSVGGSIVWEVKQALARVPLSRILLCMVNFAGTPDEYEDFRLRFEDEHGLTLPRLLPHVPRPCLVYFESDGTPRLQPVCYRTPLVWSFTGDAVGVRRTLRSFLQGVGGEPRALPQPPRRHLFHGLLSLLVLVALAGLVALCLAAEFEL